MSPVGSIIPYPNSSAQIAGMRARALQKLNPASGLHTDLDGEANPGPQFSREQPQREPRHSETTAAVPSRYNADAPHLSALFVAQLLGQALPDPEQRPSSALAAYEDVPACVLICDQRL